VVAPVGQEKEVLSVAPLSRLAGSHAMVLNTSKWSWWRRCPTVPAGNSPKMSQMRA